MFSRRARQIRTPACARLEAVTGIRHAPASPRRRRRRRPAAAGTGGRCRAQAGFRETGRCAASLPRSPSWVPALRRGTTEHAAGGRRRLRHAARGQHGVGGRGRQRDMVLGVRVEGVVSQLDRVPAVRRNRISASLTATWRSQPFQGAAVAAYQSIWHSTAGHRVLQHFVGLRAVAADAQRQGEHRPLEPAVELLERRPVPGPRGASRRRAPRSLKLEGHLEIPAGGVAAPARWCRGGACLYSTASKGRKCDDLRRCSP